MKKGQDIESIAFLKNPLSLENEKNKQNEKILNRIQSCHEFLSQMAGDLNHGLASRKVRTRDSGSKLIKNALQCVFQIYCNGHFILLSSGSLNVSYSKC